jgi:hypothetical protein
MDAVGERRLLTLAADLAVVDANYRAKKRPTYSQRTIKHDCGTPACAIGHWIRRARGRIVLSKDGVLTHKETLFTCEGVSAVGSIEFRITRDQAYELFGGIGCGGATTAKQAASYIRQFVKRVKKLEGR